MVRMTIANSNRQAISAKGILDGKKALLEELQAIVETFSANTDSLRGQVMIRLETICNKF